MRILLLPLVAALLVAGCVTPPAAETASSTLDPAGTAAMPMPVVTEWSGHVIHSMLDTPSHVRPTEDIIWPLQQEGILFDMKGPPEAVEVALTWTGSGKMMIMLHSHKEHGSNVYVEHITEMSAAQPACLRVPAEDITEGVWQVMIHTEDAQGADFTLKIGLLGGEGAIVKDDKHGHWLQDGSFDVDEHEIEPCQYMMEPLAAEG